MSDEIAVVVGAGPGLGLALGRAFAARGMRVVVAARDAKRLGAEVERGGPQGARVVGCDVRDEGQVAALFAEVERELGTPDVVVFNAGAFAHGSILDLKSADVEHNWRVGTLGGFHVGQAAARAMVARGSGTILFTGATAAMRGAAKFAAFAMSKFALRALSQSMARELGPRGIHVAHINIDGGIGEKPDDDAIRPDAIAEVYWQLHAQQRSCWTQEVDLRTWVEKF